MYLAALALISMTRAEPLQIATQTEEDKDSNIYEEYYQHQALPDENEFKKEVVVE